MKRFLIVALVAGSLGTVGAASQASAGCTAANRGGQVGPYDTVGVTYGGLTVSAWAYGNFATGPVAVCSDGTVVTDAVLSGYTVTDADGHVLCTGDGSTRHITADPFGFGASVVGPGTTPGGAACSVGISLDGITATPGASAEDVHADSTGADAGVRKDAPVKSFGEGGTGPSTVTIDDVVTEIPNGTPGHFTKGARAQSSH